MAQIHRRIVRTRLGTGSASRRANMRRRSFWHLGAGSKYARREFGSDTLRASLNTLVDSGHDCLVDTSTTLLLLLLGLFHLLDRIVGRHDLLALDTDSRGDGAQHRGAAADTHDLHVGRMVGRGEELDLTLTECLALDR